MTIVKSEHWTEKSGDVTMSTTIRITFTDIEPGRVRAMIEVENSFVGVYAEAADAQTAAAQAVEAYFSMQHDPAEPAINVPIGKESKDGYPVYFSRSMVDQSLRDAIQYGTAVEIEYEDGSGHETTRTIEPQNLGVEGLVFAYDQLRGSMRSFKVDRIKSIQRVSLI